MRLLVSLCSSTTEAPEAVVVYDAASGTAEPVSLPDSGAGVFGLWVANGSIYCVIDQGRPSSDEPERSELCRLDSATLAVRWRYAFRLGRDVHSVAARGRRLFVTSTGTDEVLELALDDQGRIKDERVIWRPDPGGERADRHHVNDVVVDGGRMLVSGFGPRPTPGSGWEDATAGFVRALPSGDLVMGPVYHPHSICRLSPDELALCESPHRRVITSTGRRSGLLPGYSRGYAWQAVRSSWERAASADLRRKPRSSTTRRVTPPTTPASARLVVWTRELCWSRRSSLLTRMGARSMTSS